MHQNIGMGINMVDSLPYLRGSLIRGSNVHRHIYNLLTNNDFICYSNTKKKLLKTMTTTC